MPNQSWPLILLGGVFLLSLVVVGLWLNRRPGAFKMIYRAQPYLCLWMGILFLFMAWNNASRPEADSGVVTVGAVVMLIIGVMGLIRWPRSQFPSADEAMAKARRMGPYETIGRLYVNFTLPALAIAGLFWVIGPTYITWLMAGFGAGMPLLGGLAAWHRQRHSSRAIATSV